MSDFVSEVHSTIEPAPGQKIISLNEYLKLERAENILEVAIKKADDMTERAQQAYQMQEDFGYQEGIDQAKSELMKVMMENSKKSIQYLNGLESEMVDLVISAVEKIIGDYDDTERAKKIVSNMLSGVKTRSAMTLRVSPNARELTSTLFSAGDSVQINVIVDHELEHDSFILETPMGITDGSLEAQIENLRTAIARPFQRSES